MRATLGNFSGPMTINATTPMMAILERPRSIISGQGLLPDEASAPPRYQNLLFSFVSTSMVLLSATCDGAAGGVLAAAASSSPLTPSLKPLTALPISPPILPSFLVPKTSITMTRTITQCQILNEPIIFSLPDGARIASNYADSIHANPARSEISAGRAMDAGRHTHAYAGDTPLVRHRDRY